MKYCSMVLLLVGVQAIKMKQDDLATTEAVRMINDEENNLQTKLVAENTIKAKERISADNK